MDYLLTNSAFISDKAGLALWFVSGCYAVGPTPLSAGAKRGSGHPGRDLQPRVRPRQLPRAQSEPIQDHQHLLREGPSCGCRICRKKRTPTKKAQRPFLRLKSEGSFELGSCCRGSTKAGRSDFIDVNEKMFNRMAVQLPAIHMGRIFKQRHCQDHVSCWVWALLLLSPQCARFEGGPGNGSPGVVRLNAALVPCCKAQHTGQTRNHRRKSAG